MIQAQAISFILLMVILGVRVNFRILMHIFIGFLQVILWSMTPIILYLKSILL